ncbi:hypothetical protein ACS127_02735 [Amphibacillus sp. Q70]|uniref:hypothetical protein n=1 Tax=Amphibacillus sp. Q70 TaxID=3453416 RepID=UPI003F8594D2
MNQKRIMMFIMLMLYLFVLRFYFFTAERHWLHFLLGVAITVMTLSTYRKLKANQQSRKAQFPLIVAYFVIFTIVIWYIQPLLVSWMS